MAKSCHSDCHSDIDTAECVPRWLPLRVVAPPLVGDIKKNSLHEATHAGNGRKRHHIGSMITLKKNLLHQTHY